MEEFPHSQIFRKAFCESVSIAKNTAAESFDSQRHACRVHFLKVRRDKPNVPRSMIGIRHWLHFPDIQKGRLDPEFLASTRTRCEANIKTWKWTQECKWQPVEAGLSLCEIRPCRPPSFPMHWAKKEGLSCKCLSFERSTDWATEYWCSGNPRR